MLKRQLAAAAAIGTIADVDAATQAHGEIQAAVDLSPENREFLKEKADDAIDVLEEAVSVLLPPFGAMMALGAIGWVRRRLNIPDDIGGDQD